MATNTALSRTPGLVVDAGENTHPQNDRGLMPLDFRHAQRWDPFLGLAEDWFSAVGFDWHPHRGFQTVTLVLDGKLEHRDNAGGYGILEPGDAQYMAAGRYALHYELAHERKPVHTLQLWLNLPPEKKLIDTRYRDLRASDAAVIREDGVDVRLHVGDIREHSGARPEDFEVPFTLTELRLSAGARFVHELPGDHAAALYVVEGGVHLGDEGRAAGEKQLAWFDPADAAGRTDLVVKAERDSHVVVYSGPPIGAPIAMGGPFVMNTREQLAQAFEEFRAGEFGAVPTGEPEVAR
jgi:redox-sensitive bicupin YhaK (pirin superfamily)